MKPKTFKQLFFMAIVMLCLIIPLAVFGLGVCLALAFNVIKLAIE